MRRQQAQEENEARELGLLYSSVPGQNNNNQQQQQQTQQQQTDNQQPPPPPSGYHHTGIPSPPNEHDSLSQRVHYSGSESGNDFSCIKIKIFFLKYK